ncbi:hypothetical protein PENSPDRAFT_695383, partial [Peniophora sp. CONT]
MPPKRAPPDYGSPKDPPDFTFAHMADRVAAFLRDSRDTRRGGQGIAHETLLLLRIRSAVQHMQRGLQMRPNVCRQLFGHAWKLFRDMVNEFLKLNTMNKDDPFIDWLRRAREQTLADNQAEVGDHAHIRRWLVENGWPEDQEVAPAEVPGKGLGPVQWWRVFDQGRQLTHANINRWATARRKQNERRRKKGLPEDSDDSDLADLDAEDEDSPPPPPKPKPVKRDPKKAPPKPPASKAPPPPPRPSRAPSNVPTLRRTAEQASADIVDARQRKRRSAALLAAESAYDDVTAIGPNAGDNPNDPDYEENASDAPDAMADTRKRKSAGFTSKREQGSEDLEEDQLLSDNDGDGAHPTSARRHARGSTAPAQSKKNKASSGRGEEAEPSTADGFDFWATATPSKNRGSNAKRKPSGTTARSVDDGADFFSSDFRLDLLEEPVSSTSKKAKRAGNGATPQSSAAAPSWSANKPKSSATKAKSALASGTKAKPSVKPRFEVDGQADDSDDEHVEDTPIADSGSDDAGPSEPRPRRAQPEPETIELFGTSSEEEEDVEEEEDAEKQMGKGKGKAGPPKKKKKKAETPAMVRGGPLLIPETHDRRATAPARREVAPATDADIARAHSHAEANVEDAPMDIDEPQRCPVPAPPHGRRQGSALPHPQDALEPLVVVQTAPPSAVTQEGMVPFQVFTQLDASLNLLNNTLRLGLFGQQQPGQPGGVDIPLAFTHTPASAAASRRQSSPSTPTSGDTPGQSRTPADSVTRPLPHDVNPAITGQPVVPAEQASSTLPATAPAPEQASEPGAMSSDMDKLMKAMQTMHHDTDAKVKEQVNTLSTKFMGEVRASSEETKRMLESQSLRLEGVETKQAALATGHAELSNGQTDLRNEVSAIFRQLADMKLVTDSVKKRDAERERKKREAREKRKESGDGDIEMLDSTETPGHPAAVTQRP